MDNGSEKKCAVCGAAASSHCGKCKFAMNCSTDCQKLAWTTHKISCGKNSLDLTMQRAAQLFQDIFLLMREKTFDNAVMSIEDRGDHLLITDSPMTPGEVQKFPIHLIKSMTEKKMILTTLICQEPTGFLHDLLLDMLRGLNVHLEEQDVQLRKPTKTVRIKAQVKEMDMNQFYHSIVRVQAHDTKKSWVIDVSGAQYSIFDSCLDENEYSKRYIANIAATYKFGRNKKIYEIIQHMKGDGALMARQGWFAAEKVGSAIASWKTDTKQEFTDLFGKEEGTFNEERKALLKGIANLLDKYALDVPKKFGSDIRSTKTYMMQRSWMWLVGLCPCQDLVDVTGQVSHEYLLH